jgi:hypothetical protein
MCPPMHAFLVDNKKVGERKKEGGKETKKWGRTMHVSMVDTKKISIVSALGIIIIL